MNQAHAPELQQIIDYATSLGVYNYDDGDERHFSTESLDHALAILNMALSIPFCHVAAEYYNSEDYDPARYLIKIDHAIGE